MANNIYHNKWHRFNHHTVALSGYPDSAIDPIASLDFPFRGIFYTLIPYITAGDEILYFIPSNSYFWWNTYNYTVTYSGDWENWQSVKETLCSDIRDYNEGQGGFLWWTANSGLLETAYRSGFSLSAEFVWPLSTEGRFPPVSGYGWHVALSSVTMRLNKQDVNIRQKVAQPVQLAETNQKTVNWNVSAAQTAYFTLTGNYTLTADKVFSAQRGGKYVMWVSLDYCPEPFMNVHFNPATYSIRVKKLSDPDYSSENNVIQLSANNITRIDFVYDGEKMLGRATHYKTFLPTTDDIYYGGVANTLNPNPAFTEAISPPSKRIEGGSSVVIAKVADNFIPPISALYLAGSGVFINYLGTGVQYWTFNLNGATWASDVSINNVRTLTGSFDRVYGNLSGGYFENPVYSYNLFGSPNFNTAPALVKQALPTPPYVLSKNKLIEIPTCLSGLEIKVRSGKDRDIRRIIVNNSPTSLNPETLGDIPFKYNFTNERQLSYRFNRVQQSLTWNVFYQRQAPIAGTRPLIWYDFIDRSTTELAGQTISRIYSKISDLDYLYQDNFHNKPFCEENGVFRYGYFRTNYTLSAFMVSSRALTGVKAPSTNQNLATNFTTFTVFQALSTTKQNHQIIWWLGDYAAGNGYGLVVFDEYIAIGAFTNGKQPYSSIIGSEKIELGKPYLVSTIIEGDETKPKRRHTIFLNGKRLSLSRSLNSVSYELTSQVIVGLSNFNMVYGKHPTENRYWGNFKLFTHLIYPGAQKLSRVIQINNYLLDKYNIRDGIYPPPLTAARININWNLQNYAVTAYNPPQNENDRPRINTFRSDSTFVLYASAGRFLYLQPPVNATVAAPWGDRGLQTYSATIPITPSVRLTAGVDFFTQTFLPTPFLYPPQNRWKVFTTPNPGERQYQIPFVENDVYNISIYL